MNLPLANWSGKQHARSPAPRTDRRSGVLLVSSQAAWAESSGRQPTTWSELTDMSCGAATASRPAIEDEPSANSQVRTCSIPLSSPAPGI